MTAGSSDIFKDVATFEAFFKTWYKVLCRHAFRMIQDKDASEDVVQEVFTKIWIQRESLSFNCSPKAYFFSAVTNACLNSLSASKRNAKPEEFDWETIGNSENFTENQVIFQETSAQIHTSINSLPPACKSIFLLSRFEELSNKEIAEALGISVKTVENQMTKALKILKAQLNHLISLLIIIILTNF